MRRSSHVRRRNAGRWKSFLAVVSAAAATVPAVVRADVGNIPVGTVTVGLQPLFNTYSAGFGTPIDMWQPGDGRLYVATIDGKIIKHDNGTNSQFFDLSANVPFTTNFAGGLLGMTFSPDYGDNTKAGYRKVYTYSTDWKTTTQSTGGSIAPGATLTGLPDFWHPEMYAPAGGGNPLTNWTNPDSPSSGNTQFDHFNVVREWTALADGSAIDTTVAPRVLMRIAHGFATKGSHNAGALRFGPDGFLYFTNGDGGGNAGQDHDGGITNGEDGHTDTVGNGQTLSVPYGKVFRIDPVTSNVGGTLSANGQYRIPASNPFADGIGVGNMDEIYAYGFRNPWKLNFDGTTLYLSDVGQHHREEIDVIISGKNYGWGYMEGNARLVSEDNQSGVGTSGNGTNIRTPGGGYTTFLASPNYQGPLVDYLTRRQYPTGSSQTAEQFRLGDGVAVTGGFVYHGAAIPELNNMYVFGDNQYRVVTLDANNNATVAYDAGRLFYFDPALTTPTIYELGVFGFAPTSTLLGFGTDNLGELYAFFDDGNVNKIVIQPNWNVDANDTWTSAGNWAHGLPNAVGAHANFGRKITAARTVSVAGAVTAGSINFDNTNSYTLADGGGMITLDAASGPAAINVSVGSHFINAPIVLNENTTINVRNRLSSTFPENMVTITEPINAQGFGITKSGGGIAQLENVKAGSVTVTGGTLKVRSRPGNPNSADGASVVNSLSIASGAVLDLTNNSMIVDYASVGSLVGDVRLHLKNNRLKSTDADATHRLGYGDNAVLQFDTFAGQTVDDGNLLVKYTYSGDTDLDGDVDGSDLANLAANWLQSDVWTGGDLDYSGFVDITDLFLLATTWQLGVPNPLPGPLLETALLGLGLPVVAPEPTSLSLAGLAAVAIGGRRRRRR